MGGRDKEGFSLSSDDHRFIEAVGLHFEDEGIPRIGGRLLGLLILADRPLSLGHIAELLRVSPASVSTNVRQFHARGLVEEVSYPGDRRHYYTFSDSAWEHQFQATMGALANAGKIFRNGLARLGVEEHARRRRMREAIEFFDFFHNVVESALEHWRERSKDLPPSAYSARSRSNS